MLEDGTAQAYRAGKLDAVFVEGEVDASDPGDDGGGEDRVGGEQAGEVSGLVFEWKGG